MGSLTFQKKKLASLLWLRVTFVGSQTSNLLTEVLHTMAEVNVEKLAGDIGTTVDKLLQQLEQAGISKKAGDMITESEKATLLDHLSKQHGGTGSTGPERMTLQRKSKSTLSVNSSGKAKSVSVEVRKKRTYVKKSAIEQQKEQERLAAEEAARKEAELMAQQEAEHKAKEEAQRKAKEEA